MKWNVEGHLRVLEVTWPNLFILQIRKLRASDIMTYPKVTQIGWHSYLKFLYKGYCVFTLPVGKVTFRVSPQYVIKLALT